MKDLGKAIVRRRKALGLTQRDLAALAECSELFLVQLEAGKPTARIDKILAVLRTLGLQLKLESGKQGIAIDTSL